MGIFDKKSKKTTNVTDETFATSDNRVAENVGYVGGNVGLKDINGSVNIQSTDYGSVDAGKEVSLAALDFGADAAENVLELGSDVVASNKDIVEQVIDVGGDISKRGFSLANDSLSFTSKSLDRSLDLAENSLSDSQDFAEGLVKTFTDQSSKNIDKALGFAQAANTSENAQLSKTVFKTVSIVAAIVAVAFVFRGGLKFK